MASSSPGKVTLSSLLRFNNYLNSLRDEFELQSNTTSTKELSQRRFNIYLGGLKGEFEIMALEIESLEKERDYYKGRVEMQVRELQENICERCGNRMTSADQCFPSFISKSHHKPTSRSVDLTQETIARDAIAAYPKTEIVAVPPSPPSSTSTVTDRHSGPEQQDWPITFNNEDERELDVQLAHTFCHKRAISCLSFSKDGKYLAGGCRDGKAYVYDVRTGTLTCVLRNLLAEYQYITAVCFIQDGTYLATGSTDGEVYIWEIKTKHVRKGFKGHSHSVISLHFSSNGRLLLSASSDNTVRLWNTRCGSARVLTDDDPMVTNDGSIFLAEPRYTSAVFSPDERYVAASHMDWMVRIWDARTGHLIRRVETHMNWVYDIGFMPDGKGLVTGSRDKTLRYWDISSLDATQLRARSQIKNESQEEATGVKEQMQPEREFLGHESSVYCITISPDGRWVASSSADDTARIWDTRNAAMQCILNHGHWVLTVDFSPAGSYLASGADDGTVRIWRYSCITPGGG